MIRAGAYPCTVDNVSAWISTYQADILLLMAHAIGQMEILQIHQFIAVITVYEFSERFLGDVAAVVTIITVFLQTMTGCHGHIAIYNSRQYYTLDIFTTQTVLYCHN